MPANKKAENRLEDSKPKSTEEESRSSELQAHDTDSSIRRDDVNRVESKKISKKDMSENKSKTDAVKDSVSKKELLVNKETENKLEDNVFKSIEEEPTSSKLQARDTDTSTLKDDVNSVESGTISETNESKSCAGKSPREFTNEELLQTYKNQQCVERGFRFLKDPWFFTSSVFVKTARRVAALAMIMALSLLVYTIAQRMIRQNLLQQNQSIPNQLGRPTQRPTLRWIFQCFQAVHLIWVNGVQQISNLTEIRQHILKFFVPACQKYYLIE